MRELQIEADSVMVNDDGESESNGSSSSESEDEKITENDKIKQALDEFMK